MPGPARRSRAVALGLSVGALGGLVTGMVLTEHPAPATAGATVSSVPDPFAAGRPATPASSAPAPAAFRQTITSAS
ncbi:MAG TPA: hypothetical protein VL337_15655 [Acidimicrobiales bacterium]|jgi:hypothetical protein|nr:hypothetical protein [Acidimicrobiales bacterium]